MIGQDNCVRVWATFKAPLGEIESARWGPRGTVALVLPGGGTLGHQCGGTKDGLVMVGSLVHIEGAGVEEAGRAQGSWAQVDSGPLGRAGVGRGSSKRRWDSVGLGSETGKPWPLGPCVPRKQEELVQQVRKRLEEALMADMLAHVEELARDGEAPLDRAGADDEEDEDEEEEEPDQDPEMEHV